MSELAAPPTVEDADFKRYQRLVLDEAGFHLSDAKRALLAGRLARRLRQLGLTSYGHYYERVRSDPLERVRMFDLLLTNETSFFREPTQFRFVINTLIPNWIADAAAGRREPSLRIWSAGCATGEEPYSVAMALRDPLEKWSIEILATDLSCSALEKAAQGIWPIQKSATIPAELLRRHVLRGVGDCAGTIKIDDPIRSLVKFRRANLHDPAQTPQGPFDLILCRNVLIYFEAAARRRAIERVTAACAPGGYLFVGHAETLQGIGSMRSIQPTIWRRSA